MVFIIKSVISKNNEVKAMKVSEINPFIRFAFEVDLKSQEKYSVAPDFRLFYILEGEGSIAIIQQIYNFSNFSIIYIPSGIPYKFVLKHRTKAVAINFDYNQINREQTSPLSANLVDNIDTPLQEKIQVINDCDILNDVVILKDGTKFSNPINNLVRESLNKDIFYNEKISCLLKSLIIDIVRYYKKSVYFSNNPNKLEHAIKFIHENYKYDIDNQVIASFTGYHPYHLNRMFNKYLGISLHQYVNNYRITISEQLLITTDQPIAAIATAVGFNNTISFTENFKSKNKLTPSKYRNCYKL